MALALLIAAPWTACAAEPIDGLAGDAAARDARAAPGRDLPAAGADQAPSVPAPRDAAAEGAADGANPEAGARPVDAAPAVYPGPVGPRSFHFVDQDNPYHWDAILALGQQHPALMFTALNQPAGIGRDRWAKTQHTSYEPSGAAMAARVDAILADAANAPALVMLDELNQGSVAYVAEFAQTMRSSYPQWQGRWGAFTTVFTGGQPAIDELLQAQAHVAVERYIEQSWYCAQGASGGERDQALARFFDGDASLARYHWLVQRRAHWGSSSPLTVLFGVTDRFMNGTSPAIYLDRMFYVWVTRTRHPDAIAIGAGGPGAWKWTPKHVAGGFGTTNTSRDLAFAESVEHYAVQGARSSRLGPVPCP